MVICRALAPWIAPWLFAGVEVEARQPALLRMDPAQRAKVLAALAALVILGLALMALAWLGARATRRFMNRPALTRNRPSPHTPLRENDWAEKPLGKPFEEE